jgi:hypothetical protein
MQPVQATVPLAVVVRVLLERMVRLLLAALVVQAWLRTYPER